MKIVTVATKSERYFPMLVQTCKHFGCELVVLGWNSEWKGFTYKFDLMRNYLKNLNDDNELICFVDAYDVVVLQPSHIIEQRFHESNAKILVAKDMNVKVYYELSARMGFGMCKGERLNSGTYMGRAGDLRQLLDGMCKDHNDCTDHTMDDQVMLTRYCKANPDQVQIDSKCSVFIAVSSEKNSVLNMADAQLAVVDNELRYYYGDGYSTPCIFHAPFNTRIEHILEQLGFDTSMVNDSDFKGAKLSTLVYAIIATIAMMCALYLILRHT